MRHSVGAHYITKVCMHSKHNVPPKDRTTDTVEKKKSDRTAIDTILLPSLSASMYRVHYCLELYYTNNVTGSCKLHKAITFAPICHFQQCVPLAQSQEIPAGMATFTGSFKK